MLVQLLLEILLFRMGDVKVCVVSIVHIDNVSATATGDTAIQDGRREGVHCIHCSY